MAWKYPRGKVHCSKCGFLDVSQVEPAPWNPNVAVCSECKIPVKTRSRHKRDVDTDGIDSRPKLRHESI